MYRHYLRVNLTIKNAGHAKARDSFADIEFSPTPPGSVIRSRQRVPALDPGEVYTISTTPVSLPEGNYKVCAIADSTNVVAESDEANNKTCRNLSVRSR